MSNTYFIKDGYEPNRVSRTLETDAGEYWDATRIDTAKKYQYHVYQLARKLLVTHDLKSVLDVGSGPPTKLANLIAPVSAENTLVDQSTVKGLANSILPWAKFVGADLEAVDDLNLDKTFNLIICADVIEHLVEPNSCMRFLYRHLAPGGRLVLSTPERDIIRGDDCMKCDKPCHVREWNKAEFAAYVASHEFQIESHDCMPTERLPMYEDWYRMIVPRQTRRWAGCQTVVATRAEVGAVESDAETKYRRAG